MSKVEASQSQVEEAAGEQVDWPGPLNTRLLRHSKNEGPIGNRIPHVKRMSFMGATDNTAKHKSTTFSFSKYSNGAHLRYNMLITEITQQ